MKERPILFSGPMVKAILEGKKTQTRRITEYQNFRVEEYENYFGTQKALFASPKSNPSARCIVGSSEESALTCGLLNVSRCPQGKAGDRLWVRETHAIVPKTAYWHTPETPHKENGDNWSVYREGWERSAPSWKPSIHMPRWASRITTEITNVRVERLQDISKEDAIAEGLISDDLEINGINEGPVFNDYMLPVEDRCEWYTDPRASFRSLWYKINGKESWTANPWVWVIEFKMVK